MHGVKVNERLVQVSRVTNQWPGVNLAVLNDLRNRSHQNG